MGLLDIGQAQYGDLTNTLADYAITPRDTDGVQDQEETTYQNTKWSTWFAYYKLIPEVKIAIDTRAIWTIGDGFTADPYTTAILDHIVGWGTDTFDSILENAMIVKRIGGDSFIEIIRADNGTIINLKPLDPSMIKIVVDRKGIIKRYEQVAKIGGGIKKFQPEEILHLTNKRVADEIHGVSDIEAIEEIIKANQESFYDMKKVMHRYVKPMMKFMLDTDDPAKIAAFIVKTDAAVAKGENLYIPQKSVEHELISVPPNATLNPLPYREHLKNYFYQVVGIPQIIMGSSGEFTESTAKIAYLAFEQSVKAEQRDVIAQIWQQLGLRIDLAFPASLKNELLSDEAKDANAVGTGQINIQPNEVMAGVGR